MYYSKKEYDLLKFQKSTSKNKKYDAILQNKLTKKIVKSLPQIFKVQC